MNRPFFDANVLLYRLEDSVAVKKAWAQEGSSGMENAFREVDE